MAAIPPNIPPAFRAEHGNFFFHNANFLPPCPGLATGWSNLMAFA
jgi:hypothetical protein